MKLRFWENWNTRTKSTVQYVGVSDWNESTRNALPREDEDDDDDPDDPPSVVDNPAVRHSHRSPASGSDRPAGIEEDRETGNGSLLSEKERTPEANPQGEAMEEAGGAWSGKFASDRSVAQRDLLRYQAYSAFPTRLASSAFETEENYECGVVETWKLMGRRG